MQRFPRFVLGALMLGGLAACSAREVSGSGGTELSLTAPADQTLHRGRTNSVAIMVNRDGFEGPVEISFANLPQGVSVPAGGTIPAGESVRDFVLRASADALLVRDHPVTVTASARDMRVSQKFEVSVEER